MAKLTVKKRQRLPSKDFVFPKKRKYPIDTAKRARSALARVEANGNGLMIHLVRQKVHKRYPKMDIRGI